MPATLVSARGLGKKYLIGSARFPLSSLRDRITEAVRTTASRIPREAPRDFWALRDVSFELAEGEALGVIGRNGSGKSTLLKLISEITEPTEGEAHIFGRVASLLEVGVGFHPELTGRENVYLNGAILGMTRAEIRRKFDEIVAFSEVETFIDTPVKRYSSGMYVRLAFSVAAHLEPDVLVVDEVLAVGDAAFQRKCLGKMNGMSTQGRAVLVVSHNMSVVSSLCTRVIWLDGGKVMDDGPASRVIGAYLSAGVERQIRWTPEVSRNDGFRLIEVSIEPSEDEYAAFSADHGITITFEFDVERTIPPSRMGFLLRNEEGTNVFESHTSDEGTSLNEEWPVGRYRMRCTIPPNLLRPGQYYVTVAEPSGTAPIVHENVLNFTITEQNSLAARDGRTALIVPRLHWTREVVT